MITQFARSQGRVLGFQFSDRLHATDYRMFTPAIDSAVAAHGQVRILIQFEAFEGWDLPAMWEDFKTTVKHYSGVERFALVGDKRREQWTARIGELFTGAEVRTFENEEIEQAWTWLEEGNVTSALSDPSPLTVPDDPIPLAPTAVA